MLPPIPDRPLLLTITGRDYMYDFIGAPSKGHFHVTKDYDTIGPFVRAHAHTHARTPAHTHGRLPFGAFHFWCKNLTFWHHVVPPRTVNPNPNGYELFLCVLFFGTGLLTPSWCAPPIVHVLCPLVL